MLNTTTSAYVLPCGGTPSFSWEKNFIYLGAEAQSAPSNKQELLASVSEILDECHQPNWDDDDSSPVLVETASHAARLVYYLPETISLPSVYPGRNGNIFFEWSNGLSKALLLSVDRTGRLVYAALLPGGEKKNGTGRFDGALPDDIRKLVLLHCQLH